MKKPSYFGYDTIRPAAHKAAVPGGSYLARRWAKHMGWEGALGGWIYKPDGQHVAHGYNDLYARYGNQIRAWARSQVELPAGASANDLAKALHGKPVR